MSKEAQRRAAARRQHRNAKTAKWVIIVLMVLVMPALFYVALKG